MKHKLETQFRKIVYKDKEVTNAYLLIHSEKHGIHLNLAEGSTGSFPAHPEQPFFIASIDKLFTSVIIGMLVEQGKLSYDDSIATYLEPDLLHHLHMFKGKDYSRDIKIRHLLNHTSGLFGNALLGTSMLDLLLEEPTEPWHRYDVIQWAKEHLESNSLPGSGFHYSDLGYYLLTLIIEEVTSESYHEFLANTIFQPLQMNQTYMLQHSKPLVESKYPVADCYIHHKNVILNIPFGMDFAGGRIVATTEDLLKFMKAFVGYQLLSEETMEKMKDWARYFLGIDYGYGLMQVKHVPLFMPKRYSVFGHAGSTGSFMFYHPKLETYFTGSLNHFGYHRKGMMLMFKMIDILSKHEETL